MSIKTSIGYVDRTWNVYSGCYGPNGTRCTYCWARTQAQRLRGRFGYPDDDPFQPVFHADRLQEPYKWRNPCRVAVGFMGDLAYVSEENFLKVLEVADNNYDKHSFIFLTHQPGVLNRYSPWPLNAWVGSTATNQEEFNNAIMFVKKPPLIGGIFAATFNEGIDAAVRFLSCEPLTGAVNPPPETDIDWLIIGACTGPKAKHYPTKKEWVKVLITWADRNSVPVFMKNNLRPLFPELRQELPTPEWMMNELT